VLFELVAGPRTSNNRVAVDRALVEDPTFFPVGSPTQCGICGADGRVPSTEAWTGRLTPVGCTASIYNEDSCMVTAGHCIGGEMVVMFNTPLSDPDCTPNNPPVADQFPVTDFWRANNGPGDDWAVMATGQNNLGETAYERQGELRRIAPDPPDMAPAPCQFHGYGLDETCETSSTQQFSSGSITSVSNVIYSFYADLRTGNSGSAFLSEDGEIIGVVTHCSVGCPNLATRIDHPTFVWYRDQLCRPANDTCADARVVTDGTYSFATINATTDGDDLPGSCDEGSGVGFVEDVWYRYVAPDDGVTTISTCPTGFDARIAVYDGCGGALIACDDNGCGGQAAVLSLPVAQGQEIVVRIGGVPGGSSNGTSDVTISTEITTGACCIDNVCSQQSSSACAAAGGTYSGDLSDCTPELCAPPSGACCVDGQCFEISEQNCAASNGTFLGEGVACEDQCTPATGACCLAAACITLTEADCNQFEGTYAGDGVACGPTACTETCLADITGPTPGVPDGNVDALDILLMISEWGSPCEPPCMADITGPTPGVPDGNVDALDYLMLISQWGNPAVCP
jgi:hypothetical protein